MDPTAFVDAPTGNLEEEKIASVFFLLYAALSKRGGKQCVDGQSLGAV